mgnify:CR=1 FL=1
MPLQRHLTRIKNINLGGQFIKKKKRPIVNCGKGGGDEWPGEQKKKKLDFRLV